MGTIAKQYRKEWLRTRDPVTTSWPLLYSTNVCRLSSFTTSLVSNTAIAVRKDSACCSAKPTAVRVVERKRRVVDPEFVEYTNDETNIVRDSQRNKNQEM
jgi:hypothetical protein